MAGRVPDTHGRGGTWPEVPAERLARVVEEMARAYPQIDAVYLFGSRARGDARPGSDLDVAVLLSAPAANRVALEAELERFLEDRLALPVDVVLLRRELPPALLFDIFRVETILFARDYESAHLLACRVRAEYRELHPRLQRQFEQVRQRLKEHADALDPA